MYWTLFNKINAIIIKFNWSLALVSMLLLDWSSDFHPSSVLGLLASFSPPFSSSESI